jgi:hypothetical protein
MIEGPISQVTGTLNCLAYLLSQLKMQVQTILKSKTCTHNEVLWTEEVELVEVTHIVVLLI